METEKKKVEVSLEMASCDTASKLSQAVDLQRTLDEEKQVRELGSCKCWMPDNMQWLWLR